MLHHQEIQSLTDFSFYKFIYFTYSLLAELGLHCCMQAFSSCSERGPLFIAVRMFLIEVRVLLNEVVSLVEEHGL